MKGDKLTEKQQRFVEAYVGEAKGNATQAARIAGYKGNPKTLESMGRENLAKHGIRIEIDRVLEKVRSAAVATTEEVLAFLTKTMRGEVVVNVIAVTHDGDEESPKSFPTFVETKDRLKAAELLLKAQGAFIERHDVKVEHNARFVFEVDGRGPVTARLEEKTGER